LTSRRSVADERSPLVRLLGDPQRGTQFPKVPVVDAAVVELVSKLEE
jgi:hypothetical protein